MWRKRREPSPELLEARAARERAEADLARIKAQTPAIKALGDRLRRAREANHFAEVLFGRHQ